MLSTMVMGFTSIFTVKVALLILLGVIVGIIFGAIPGLTANMAIVLCLPMTFGMSPIEGLALLCSLYIGGLSGGLITAILLKIPGTPSSIATTFDGHPMAVRGEAGRAIGVGVFYSGLGTLIGVVALMFLAPYLAQVTIKFGSIEYFGVMLFALTMVASLSGGSILKGVISALFGILISIVGQAPIDSALRYTFGNYNLSAGFSSLAICVGVFAVPEILSFARNKYVANEKAEVASYKIKGFGFTLREFKDQFVNFIRSALIGLGIGILPGLGGNISNLVAYSSAKNNSKYPEKFGTGIIDGVVASETSNNATIGGAMAALLTLGIPGDMCTALLLGGFMIHGITPGPVLFKTEGVLVYGIFAAMILATLFMMVVELYGLKAFVKVLNIPKHILMPIVMIMCTIGAYGGSNRVFDVICFAIFGFLGYFMMYLGLPMTPMVLGFILGTDIETYFRRGLQLTHNQFSGFFTHPIFVVFFVIAVFSVVFSFIKNRKDKKKATNSK